MSNGGRLLRRGDTFDIEDWRTTHRLRLGQHILSSAGVKAEWAEHSEKCMRNPKNAWNRCFGWNYHCDHDCPRGRQESTGPVWPEWATQEMFDLAYRLADEVQSERGHWHQLQINEERREREARDRAERT